MENQEEVKPVETLEETPIVEPTADTEENLETPETPAD